MDGLSSDLKNVVIVPFCHSESDITLRRCEIGEEKGGKASDIDSKSELFMSKFLDVGKDVP